MSLERLVGVMAVAVALLVQACGSGSKPIAPKLSLGMTRTELARAFPDLKGTSDISVGWKGMVSSVTMRDHHDKDVLFDEERAEIVVHIAGGANIHIRPQAKRPLRDVIAFLDKEIPAMLSVRGWREHTPFAAHWDQVRTNKCVPTKSNLLVRWELDVERELAPDKLDFGLKCDSLDLDSPASWFVIVRSGGGELRTTPKVRGR